MQHSLAGLDVGFSTPYIAPEHNPKETHPCLGLIASSGSDRWSSESTVPSSDQRVLHRPSEPAALLRHVPGSPPHSYIDTCPYFCKHRIMTTASGRKVVDQVAKYADMFSAIGTEPRLRIMQLLLSAHPDGLVVGDIQQELDIPSSTLSHHLDKLRNEDLVLVRRESTFLRYTANTEALQEVLQFLYAECCTRNKAVKPRDIVQVCK
jgi:ArsR family transcriptional regulator